MDRHLARLLKPALVVLCLLVTGCASDDPSATPTPGVPIDSSPAPTSSAAPSSPSEPAATVTEPDTRTGIRIISADSEFGPMLFDATGQPIYLFSAESGARPSCYDDCAEDWPPVLTDGEPGGSAEVSGRLLGTTQRAGGSVQVTYAGHPLYYYAHEGKYEVLCHDVEEYGGTWLAVRPDGTPAPS